MQLEVPHIRTWNKMCPKEDFMLVLSRQRDQSIMIGDDVEIMVVDIRGDKVRLGINAPKLIIVHRKEIYLAIKAEKLCKWEEDQRKNQLTKQSGGPILLPTGTCSPDSLRGIRGAA